MIPVHTAEGAVGSGLDAQAAWRDSGLNWNSKGGWTVGWTGRTHSHSENAKGVSWMAAGSLAGEGAVGALPIRQCFHSGITVAAQKDQWGCPQCHTLGNYFRESEVTFGIGILVPSNLLLYTNSG